METLDHALSRIWQQDWQYRRSGKTLLSQATCAAQHVAAIAVGSYMATNKDGFVPDLTPTLRVSNIAKHHIELAVKHWYGTGKSPATIQKRLNCLSKLGVNVEGCRKPQPKQLKWHLKESDLEAVLTFCIQQDYKSLGHLIMWTTRTGLRIEESLRLTWDSFQWARQVELAQLGEVSVPGTKTGLAQAALPLGREIGTYMATVRHLYRPRPKPFPLEYTTYQTQWNHVREHFGWQDEPTATLKALRRSAARYLHVDCGMPLHMVQQYLRHESMDTTLEYLRLTGGYGTEEMRRYLK